MQRGESEELDGEVGRGVDEIPVAEVVAKGDGGLGVGADFTGAGVATDGAGAVPLGDSAARRGS